MPRWLNPPNALTALRILLTPVVIVAILEARHMLALEWFLLAAVTDVVDGALARRLEQPTVIGAYFDPIADKCLLSGVFLALGWSRLVPRWMVAIVLGRDLYILLAALACLLWTPLRKFPPSLWGKASTFMQISTVVAWLVRDAYGTAPLRAAADILMWLAASLALASGIEYTIRGTRLLRATPRRGRGI
ncbi:MAG: CDP-alcohol phosphatidyltransferase family protein [Bryobacteraceae bacterium]|jgi:cardiolipin synthase